MKQFLANLGEGLGCLLIAIAFVVVLNGSVIVARVFGPKTPMVQPENSGK